VLLKLAQLVEQSQKVTLRRGRLDQHVVILWILLLRHSVRRYWIAWRWNRRLVILSMQIVIDLWRCLLLLLLLIHALLVLVLLILRRSLRRVPLLIRLLS